MKQFQLFSIAILATTTLFISCNNDNKKEAIMKEPILKEDNITYSGDGTTMNGFIVYDENIEGARPAIIVVHEWWGLNDYSKMRARELAKLGYIAMALDMYGEGKTADNPTLAGELATPFYQNPQMAKARFDAAVSKLKTYTQTDGNKIGAIGYCFGGTQVLNMANLGEDLKAVVSFHGGLQVVQPEKNTLKAPILVCHGGADPFVPQEQVDLFRKQMDSVGANYTFKVYEGSTHAFTNPNATAMGEKFSLPIKYNAAADTASWNDMKEFLGKTMK